MSLPIGSLPQYDSTNVSTVQVVLPQQLNIEANGLLAFNQVVDQKAKDLEAKANAIDAYFGKYNLPLEGMGMKMAQEAKEHNLDYRLLPAIAMAESTGGKFAHENNPFGWNCTKACKTGFSSFEEAVEVVAKNLGGDEPKTAHYYAGKSIKEILNKYNPPKIAPRYEKKVINIMKQIGPDPVEITASV